MAQDIHSRKDVSERSKAEIAAICSIVSRFCPGGLLSLQHYLPLSSSRMGKRTDCATAAHSKISKVSDAQGDQERSTAAGNGAVYLDQSEILRSMMAAERDAKGKGRNLSPSESSEDEKSDAEGSGEENGLSVQTDGTPSPRVLDDSSVGGESEAESSTSAARRHPSPGSPVSKLKTQEPLPSRVSIVRPILLKDEHPNGKGQTSPFGSAVQAGSTFESLGLSKPLISAMSGISIRSPTEIQTACIPPILQGQLHHSI